MLLFRILSFTDTPLRVLDRCYISHVSPDDDHLYHHPLSLHRGRDHIVVVDHRVRIDKLIAWRLHFGLGGFGLLWNLLAKFKRGKRLQFGLTLVSKLLVGLLEALKLSAQTGLLIVLGVEVDEDNEEDHQDDHTDAADHCADHSGGLDLGGGSWEHRGPVLSVSRVTGGGVTQVTLGLIPILTESEIKYQSLSNQVSNSSYSSMRLWIGSRWYSKYLEPK